MPESLPRLSTRVEWRACCADKRDAHPDVSGWCSRQEAEAQATSIVKHADPPFDDVWLECRIISDPQRVDFDA